MMLNKSFRLFISFPSLLAQRTEATCGRFIVPLSDTLAETDTPQPIDRHQ